MKPLPVLLSLLVAACGAAGTKTALHLPAGSAPADLVLVGGRVVTLDPETPEGTALAIAAGRVLRVGSDVEVLALAGPDTERLDLDGALAVPGLIEGHGHFTGIGAMARQVNLLEAETFDEVVAAVRAAARDAKPGELIRGRGWHQSKWTREPDGAVQGLPTHHALSAAVPDHPVVLTHASGHMALANAAAMRLAGVDRDTPDPEGGELVRDARGEPIGIFRENAEALLAPVFERAAAPALRDLLLAARDECLAKGITGFHDAGSPLATFDGMDALAREGELGLRLYVMLSDSNERLAELEPPAPPADPARPRIIGIKRSYDGALGSHGAYLLEPYADLPSSTGFCTYPMDDLRETALQAERLGLQLCVHAIGDRANREVLDVFEASIARNPALRNARWRVEHAQHLDPAEIPRFAELGAIASMQTVHCTSDAPFVIDRLGERRAHEGAYVWRSLLEHGAVVTNGTDAPVEDVDPIANFHSAVTRLTRSGEPFFADQKLTRHEALDATTLANAYAAFAEHEVGSLAPGKLADVTVLSKDLLTVPENELRDARVVATIVGGKVLYRARE